MKLGKLRKQIAREMRQNPKKAVVLGLMCVVALYYWVPIIRRWTSGKDQPKAGDIVAAAPKLPNAMPTSHSPTPLRWEAVAEQIEQNEFSHPSTVQMNWNPFESQSPGSTGPVVEEPQAEQPRTPADAGLVLESTVIGASRQTAVINGRAYVTGDFVESKADPQLRFRLVKVLPDRVTLQHGGQTFELPIKVRQASRGIEPWPDTSSNGQQEPE